MTENIRYNVILYLYDGIESAIENHSSGMLSKGGGLEAYFIPIKNNDLQKSYFSE